MNPQASKPLQEARITSGQICPYLGLDIDPETHYSFSHSGNCCHRVQPAFPVAPDHQGAFCLTAHHLKCEIYPGDWQGALPQEIVAKAERQRKPIYRIMALLSVLVIIAILTFAYLNRDMFSQKGLEIHLQTETLSSITTPPPQFTATHEATSDASIVLPLLTAALPTSSPTSPITLTIAPSITPTPSPQLPTPGPGMETPFGPGGKYVLYTVKTGESLNNIAYNYQTTSEVIRAANILPGYVSVPPGTVLVIIPGEKDLNNVPVFVVVLVESATLLDELARQYQVSPDELREINDLGAGDIIPAGRWLIIPFTGE